MTITESKAGTGGQPPPPIEVSKPPSHDATVSHNMTFLHAPQPQSKLNATPWQSPSLSIPYQPLPPISLPPHHHAAANCLTTHNTAIYTTKICTCLCGTTYSSCHESTGGTIHTASTISECPAIIRFRPAHNVRICTLPPLLVQVCLLLPQ